MGLVTLRSPPAFLSSVHGIIGVDGLGSGGCFQNIPRCYDLNELLASLMGELTSTGIPY